MQRLARRQPLDLLGSHALLPSHPTGTALTIYGIAYDRVANVSQMHSDLMRPTRAEVRTHQVARLEPGDRLHARHRWPPSREDRHAFAVHGMARDRRVDIDRIWHVPPDEGGVRSHDGAPGEGAGE
jgi:hypothetical protein